MAESDYGVSGSNAFWAPIQKRIEQNHSDEETLKAQKRSFYSGIASNSSVSDDVRNWAVGEQAKLLNPGTAKQLKQNHPVVHAIGKLFGMGGGEPQQPTPIPAPQGPVFDTAAANKRTLDFDQQKSDIEQARQVALQKEKNLQAGTLGKPEEYRDPTDPAKPPVIVRANNKTRQVFTLQGEPAEIPEGYAPYKAPATGTRKPFRYSVKGPDGKDQEITVWQDSKTQQVFDKQGKPTQIESNWEPVDEEAKLAKIRGSYYGTGEMNNLTRAFKSQYPEATDEEAERAAGAIALEKAKRELELKGAGRSTERPMVVNGEVKAVPLISQPVRRPFEMPTVMGGAAPGVAPVRAPGSQAPAAAAAPRAAGGPVPAPQAAAPAGAPAAGRTLGVPPAQYRSMLNDFRAVRAGASQLFGDPNVPDVKGLIDYGDLADNAGSRDRLGKAFRLTFDGLQQDSSGGSAGIHGEGGALNVGGIGTWVGNQLGIPKAVAGQQAKMMQDAISSLTPREREAYNATIASAEGIIGLRRITGASASAQSIRAIQEAMPIIGVNTTDSHQFDDKGKRLAVEFSAGTRGLPRSGFDPETVKQLDEINTLPQRLAKRGAATAPKTAPKAPTIDTQKEYDALPKGTEYVDKKDGKRYKKP